MKSEIICVLDKSGSMEPLRADVIGGLNSFMDEQKKGSPDASVSVFLFNHEYSEMFKGKPIKDVQPFVESDFVPSGTTALLDSVAKAIDESGKRFSEMSEGDRPERVMMIIVTDGEENSSKEITKKVLFDKITHQKEKYKWEFVFLAANQDAIQEGNSLGIPMSSCANFGYDSMGVKSVFRQASGSAISYTSTGSYSLQKDKNGFVKN